MSQIPAVTLDLWRTLIIEDPSAERGSGLRRNDSRIANLRGVLAAAGHTIAQESMTEAFRRVRDDMDHAHLNGVDRTFRAWVWQLVEYASPGILDKLQEDAALQAIEAVDEPFLESPPMPHPAAANVLEALNHRGLKVALISNTGFTSGNMYRRWFERLGWTRYFQATTFSNESAVAKPTDEIFLETLEALQTEPACAMHVGDSLHNDIAGAHEVGMTTAWIAGFDLSEPRIQPDYRLEDLRELPDVVDVWLRSLC